MKHKGGDSNKPMQRKFTQQQVRKKNDNPRPFKTSSPSFWDAKPATPLTNEEIAQLQLQALVFATTVATLSQ